MWQKERSSWNELYNNFRVLRDKLQSVIDQVNEPPSCAITSKPVSAVVSKAIAPGLHLFGGLLNGD